MTFSVVLLGIAIIFNMIGNHLFKFAGIASEMGWKSKNFLIYLSGGFGFYFFSALLYVVCLKKLPLNVAYPALSLTYVVTLFSSNYFFQEPITPAKIIGALVIVGGVFIMNYF